MSGEMKGNEVAEVVEAAAMEEKAGVQSEIKHEAEKKYTDADVDRIIAKKIANERKRMQKLFEEEQQVSELESREQKVLLRELKVDAKEALAERGLPASLAGVLDYSDKEALESSIDEVEKVFRSAVEVGVKDRLRGTTPRASYGYSSKNYEEDLHNAFKPFKL